MNIKYNILILTTVRAPYRVDLFNEFGKISFINLTVCFEQFCDSSRNDEWYKDDFKFFNGIFLNKSKKNLKKIKWDFIKMISKEYDLIIFYEYSTITSILSILKCKLNHIKYAINCDGAINKKKSLKDFIKKYCIMNASACLANGESAKKYFLKFNAQPSSIYKHNFSSLYRKDILNKCIPFKEKILLRKKLNLPFDKLYISVGSFIERKGFEILLEAVSNINKVNKNFGIVIIGGGPNKSKYLEFINKNHLSNIILIDFVCKEKIFEYYDAADAFIFPTREDIWGLVINEAMARGLPILSSDMSMAALELVDNHNGFIFKSESIKSLEQEMRKMNELDRYQLEELGMSSLKKIKNYNVEYLAKMHADVVKKVVK